MFTSLSACGKPMSSYCPKCHSEVYLSGYASDASVTCPKCHKTFRAAKAKTQADPKAEARGGSKRRFDVLGGISVVLGVTAWGLGLVLQSPEIPVDWIRMACGIAGPAVAIVGLGVQRQRKAATAVSWFGLVLGVLFLALWVAAVLYRGSMEQEFQKIWQDAKDGG
jgi:hypothetical protein